MNKGKIGAILVAIILVIALICVVACLEKVPAGYVGVVYNMNGGVDGEILTQGWHIVSPTKKITEYSIGIEQSYLTAKDEGDSPKDDSFEVPSSDGKGLKVELTFTYRYDVDTVANTFTRFKGQSGREILTSFIKPNIISWTKEVTSRYPVTEILGDKRASLNAELSEYLHAKFESYGIVIESVSLIDINPDEETRSAIQKKVTAQQEYELANIEAQTAMVQAEKERQVAEVNAAKAVIEANAEAEVVRIAAQAEAEANREIAASLTPELIEKIMYERWDGELPKVSTGSDSGTIVSVGEIFGSGELN